MSKTVSADMTGEKRRLRRTRLIWSILLCFAYPFAIILPFLDAYVFRHVSMDMAVPFEFSNSLLFTSSILFGFTSLIIVSKDWIDKRIWTLLIPPLALIILAGVTIGNFALGSSSSVTVLLYSSAAFNANVVSTGFVLGYIMQVQPKPKD